MDAFVKAFFKGFSTPGVDLTVGQDWRVATFANMALRVEAENYPQKKFFKSVQDMTMLGRMEAALASGASSLDGLCKDYLTPEGGMALTMLGESLKNTAGLQSHMLSAHISAMQKWDWGDNHVSLLLNMLRFTFLMKAKQAKGTLTGDLYIEFASCDVTKAESSDSEDSIDPDEPRGGNLGVKGPEVDMKSLWPDNYPEADTLTDGWPCGEGEGILPTFIRLTDAVPAEEHSALDLRGLSAEQCRFVLLMLAPWHRRSRVRIDFDLPALAETVYYRSDREVNNLSDWTEKPGVGGTKTAAPALPKWGVCWAALKHYVTKNRVYDHFSVALYLFCCSCYQFVPTTLEGVAWLTIDWQLSLPVFRSVRGRYTCLNEGSAALVSQRALNEWGYITGSLEKLNLMALVYAQAYFTGLAIRSVRYGLEDNPKDLYTSEITFQMNHNTVAAAAAESIRGEAPMPGMSGVYLGTDTRFDEVDYDRTIRLVGNVDSDAEDDYDIVEDTVTVLRQEAVQAPVWTTSEGPDGIEVIWFGDTGPDLEDRVQQAEAIYKRMLQRGPTAHGKAPAATGSSKPQDPFAKAVDEALKNWDRLKAILKKATDDGRPVKGDRDESMVTVIEAVYAEDSSYSVRVPRLNFPGYPTLIVPLAPFPYDSPLSLKGVVKGAELDLKRHSWHIKAQQVWSIANLVHLCGYELVVDIVGAINMPRMYCDSQSCFTWPILMQQDAVDDVLHVKDMMRWRNNAPDVELPQLNTKFAADVDLAYSMTVGQRGVMSRDKRKDKFVTDWGIEAELRRDMTVTYTVPEGVADVRGWIKRGDLDFHFVPHAQGGGNPEQPDANVVP
ncbi:MAG: coat protein [Koper totivirus 1]|nr:MAG: coat protein [Koper totivirus 1]